jgi:hypothetical protein
VAKSHDQTGIARAPYAHGKWVKVVKTNMHNVAVCSAELVTIKEGASEASSLLVANKHTLFLVGTSIQVTLVWLVVVGQLPQFDARIMLYWIAGQSGATGLPAAECQIS